MEQLAEALPDHRAIRLALASGFAQYGYAFVNEEADRVADKEHQPAPDTARASAKAVSAWPRLYLWQA